VRYVKIGNIPVFIFVMEDAILLTIMEDDKMLPSAFEDKMIKLIGPEEYQEYLNCFQNERYYGLRVNTNKISVDDFLKISPFELTPVPWIPNGFYYDGEKDQPSKHPYYFAGLYYLQEPSAMTPASRIPVEPGERVLDVCAAPGGKATELGAKLQGQGVLIANDISNSRAKGLLKNIELFGIGNVMVLSEEPGKLIPYFEEYFDKILIDAPCSGEGMFRKDRKMIRSWEEHGPEFFSKLQRSIITQAAQMLRPGGMILYSTCTFDALENEGTVQYLLDEYPEFEICPMEGYEGFCSGHEKSEAAENPELAKTVRIFPHKMKGEGHYLALLKKGGSSVKKENQSKKNNRKLPEELETFLKDIDYDFDSSRMEFHGERVYYMPGDTPDLKGVRFLRTGLLMGELKKKRFEPSQALAMWLTAQNYRNVISLPAGDDRVIRYLKGETIDVEDQVSKKDKGWYLFCVDGYPLGFGKLANETLKNKYLPGWRWMS
jgi:NOL1/NOP2/sun family putative RNA methylase